MWLASLPGVAESRASELGERLREARLTRGVIGPRLAIPLAGWLERTFDEEHDEATDGTPVVEVEPAPVPESHVEDHAFAAKAPQRPLGLIAVAKTVIANIKEHNLVVVAAGIAFWGLLAIPAVLFSTVSIAGLALDPDTVRDQVNEDLAGLPEEVRTIIGDQLANVSGSSTGGLVTGIVLGLVLALWSSSGAMAKVMATLNTIYGVSETRKFVVLRGLALLMTFGGIVFISGAVFLLAVMPSLFSSIDAIGASATTLFNWLRFPVLAFVMTIGLGVLYHLGPNRRGHRYRPVNWGAFVATALWLALSSLFTVYTSTVDSYNETYGSLGGLVVLLLWLFITAFVVLIGAEVHSLTDPD